MRRSGDGGEVIYRVGLDPMIDFSPACRVTSDIGMTAHAMFHLNNSDRAACTTPQSCIKLDHKINELRTTNCLHTFV